MGLPNDRKCAIIYAMNVQVYLRQEDKEQENHNFCSPEQVLSLLRFVRQADFARLATHPFAYSKTTLSRVKGTKISDAPHQLGAAVYDFVTIVILERITELRSAYGRKVRINAMAEKEENILSDIELDALSQNKELRCWSLLVHHYINGFSISALSEQYRYSIRQIEYQLKSARNKLAKILLNHEERDSTSTVQGHVGMSRVGVRLSLSEKESMLGSMTTAYSAPCSALLWGDWSPLASKKAIAVPINRRVIVALEPSAEDFDCSIYERSDVEGAWILNEWYSAKAKRVISRSWSYLSSLRKIISSNLQPCRICVFSDVPFSSGIHERVAMSLCLAGCINNVFGLEKFNKLQAEQIAAILESFWYPEVSRAPIICSSRSPNLSKVMIFDRTGDGGIDFDSISRSYDKEIRRNRFLNGSAIKINWVDFDLAKLVALSCQVTTTDLDEVHKFYARNFGLIKSMGFGYLFELLVSYILDLNYEKVGMMLNLHQDILASIDLSSSSFNTLLRTLRCEPKVLGIKPSCCLATHSALIALIDGNPLEVTQGLGDLVQPISPFLTPTPGLIRIF